MLTHHVFLESPRDYSDKRLGRIDQHFEQIDKRFEEIEIRFERIDLRLTRLEQNLVRLENDHGEKLAALLDGYQQNAKILADHTERLNRIEAKLEAHDIQIQILNKSKSNKCRAK